MQVDRAEFLRYLGWRGQETDELLLAKLDDAAERCLDAASPRMVARRFALGKNLELAGTGFILEGQDIRAHLAGCSEVYLFAATLGIAAERELAKLSARGAYEALLFDTACSCAIESYCDDICDDLQKSCGKRLLPRFSCGYGDFPLEAQRDICRLLRTDTAIGLCRRRHHGRSPLPHGKAHLRQLCGVPAHRLRLPQKGSMTWIFAHF